jgi:hypothetical protein
MQPARAAIRRRLPCRARQSAAVQKDDGGQGVAGGRYEVLDVEVFNGKSAVWVVDEGRGGREVDLTPLLAGNVDHAPTNRVGAKIRKMIAITHHVPPTCRAGMPLTFPSKPS